MTLAAERSVPRHDAVERTNATTYGLAGAVFSGSAKRGMNIARRMRSGMTSVNSVIAFASVPALPFGGVGDSGFGRIHGPDGLKESPGATSITRQRVGLPVALLSFSRSPKVTNQLAKVAGACSTAEAERSGRLEPAWKLPWGGDAAFGRDAGARQAGS